MAEGDEYEMTNCPVCFELYEETGEHVPRILPCHHTVCENCTIELLKDRTVLECPECRRKHRAKKGARSFQQNKYILGHIKTKAQMKPKEKQKEYDICGRHCREKSLFCSELRCQMPICPVCLSKDHRSHNVMDIQQKNDEMRKILSENIATIKQDLFSKKEKLLKTQQEVKKKNAICLEKLKSSKNEIMFKFSQQFDKLVEDTSETMNTFMIDYDISNIDDNVDLLSKVTENGDETTFTYNSIKYNINRVRYIALETNRYLSSEQTYRFLEYNESEVSVEDVERIIGGISERETKIDLKYTRVKDLTKETEAEGQRASQLTFTVTKSILTRYKGIRAMTLLGSNSVVVSGYDSKGDYLTQYSLQTGRKIYRTRHDAATGMAEIMSGRTQCLAVFGWYGGTTHFYDANNLSKRVHTEHLHLQGGGVVCRASPSTLVYASSEEDFRWLDCSTVPPKLMPEVTTAHQPEVHDMCCVKHEGDQFLIAVDDIIGIYVYKTRSNEFVWSIQGEDTDLDKALRCQAVTADDSGYIYVCDEGSEEDVSPSIQMFSIDGTFLRTVLTEGEQGLGEPRRIRWCRDLSSLIVAHEKNGKCLISVIKVQ